SRRPHPCAGHARHPLSPPRPGRHVDGVDRVRAAVHAAAGLFHDEAVVEMKLPTLRDVSNEAKLLLIGIPVLIWTLLPIYHLTLFAVSPKDQAMGGQLWPDHPTLHNFEVVFKQQHHYLNFFWLQMWNSLVIAVATGLI